MVNPPVAFIDNCTKISYESQIPGWGTFSEVREKFSNLRKGEFILRVMTDPKGGYHNNGCYMFVTNHGRYVTFDVLHSQKKVFIFNHDFNFVVPKEFYDIVKMTDANDVHKVFITIRKIMETNIDNVTIHHMEKLAEKLAEHIVTSRKEYLDERRKVHLEKLLKEQQDALKGSLFIYR